MARTGVVSIKPKRLFVLVDRALHMTLRTERDAQVVVGRRMVRFDFNGAAIMRGSLIQAALLLQSGPEIVF